MNSQSHYNKADDIVGIAVRGVQPSYARELDISKDIPHEIQLDYLEHSLVLLVAQIPISKSNKGTLAL
ncbi:hypothetical protein G6F68_017471 [Rhizopus microsporus]|nr:hypothetical protein G6F68_017471 [Rhizopus microsporus]